MRKIICLLLLGFVCSCKSRQQADAVYYNATVYTLDSAFSTCSAFAVKDGKIIATGSNREMLEFKSATKVDLHGKFVYPGFYDAHCHFYGYGVDLKKIGLFETKSFEGVMDTVIRYRDKRFMGWVFGRGWDQNDWETEKYPDKTRLDSLFPDVPVFLMRIDGHAALVNQAALNLAGITAFTTIAGGEVEVKNGKLTGILIDNAVDLVKALIPLPSREAETEALLQAQKNCFAVGLTSIADAGLEKETILLIDSLQKAGQLKMSYYAMITWNAKNKEYFFEKGKIKTEKLNACSFKIYADGALGSRGACMLQPYNDSPGHYGYLLHPVDSLKKAAEEIAAHGFQMCTHCIGDSAVRLMLHIYGNALKGNTLARWRIEHCQIVNTGDFALFGKYGVIPSVQPTHATSDMYWAPERIGQERMKGAYAYNDLKNAFGMVANGSDFPVESINPLYGFYAAVVRKDKNNFPANGFQPENALSRSDALRGMTVWAAYSCLEEKEKGSLEKGKHADFVVMEEDLMTAPAETLWKLKVLQTFVQGEKVYERK
jgi:predicted amidohydrolase YtcJ